LASGMESMMQTMLQQAMGQILNNGGMKDGLKNLAAQWNELIERQRRIEAKLDALLAGSVPGARALVGHGGHRGNGFDVANALHDTEGAN
jgi:hypothetical protein